MVTPESPYVSVEITGQSVDEESDDLTATMRFSVAADAPEGLLYFPVRLYVSSQSELTVPAFISIRK
jgi:hypothetical protein